MFTNAFSFICKIISQIYVFFSFVEFVCVFSICVLYSCFQIFFVFVEGVLYLQMYTEIHIYSQILRQIETNVTPYGSDVLRMNRHTTL